MHRAPRARLPGLALALGLALCACGPELEPITWEQVDIEALREAMAEPTATVDAASLLEVEQAIIQDREAYEQILIFARDVFSSAGSEGAHTQTLALAKTATGTSVYLLVACPGPEDEEVAPFSAGHMRVDSAQLELDSDLELDVDGQILLSYEQCRIGDYVYEGRARLFEDPSPELVVLGYVPDTVAYTRVDDPAPPNPITQPLLWDLGNQIRALFELNSGETLVFEWSAGTAQLEAQGSNGSFACEILGEELSCELP